MAFQIKDFASIVVSAINWMRATSSKVTDFNVGSTARTLIEAPAVEIDEYYMQMLTGLSEAIPVSVYNSFDFAALAAIPATGVVRVSITSSGNAVVIGAGTTFSAAGKSATYVATSDVTIAAGNTFGDVPVACNSAGVVGNIASAAIFTLSPPPPGFVSASNAAPFLNGRDDESPDQRKLRFSAYIAALNRSTLAALVYGAKTAVRLDPSGSELERVASAVPVEPYLADNAQPVAWVKLYVHNGSGATSGALVALTQNVINGYTDVQGNQIPGWKAAGVKVDVLAATDAPLNVTGVITSAGGYDHVAQCTSAAAALSAYLAGLGVGETAVRSEMIALVMNIEGVYNVALSAPAGDTVPAATAKIMPGVIAIT